MHADDCHTFLLASADPTLLSTVEPALATAGIQVRVALSAEAALKAMTGTKQPDAVLLDEKLPGMPIEQLLSAVPASPGGKSFLAILIADGVSPAWVDRLEEGALDDMIPRTAAAEYCKLRIELALRSHRVAGELASLREAKAADAQRDRLTGVYNREALLSMLFRETDRVQRLNTPLSLALFDIDDFGHWNARLGTEVCDGLLCQVVARTQQLLRSYDLLGRLGMDAFLVALPGCAINDAAMLAERLRLEVFSAPYRTQGESIRMSACFGLAASHGRSPVVVLREAEEALARARAAGPESIECYADGPRPYPPPVTYLSPTSDDELLAW
jgi:two-component system, cell cycle response regulator